MTKEEIKSLINNKIGGQGNQVDLGGALKSVLNELVESGESMESITWAELKAKRDEGKLVAGAQYRITDYECTTSQENTYAASHKFDIIVTADDERTLNENARAIWHEGDEYFKDCILPAWRLKYSLDNDSSRFKWADENGKGVICGMIDEWGNDCPYDFKNIMFPRYWDEDAECYKREEGHEDNEWCYTFCMIDKFDGKAHDVSVEQFKYPSDDSIYYTQHGNVIRPWFGEYGGEEVEEGNRKGRYSLNDIVFVTNTEVCGISEDYSYGEFYGFYDNTFGNNCSRNTFGNNCYSNTFGNDCSNNSFGNYCYSNTFGNNCSDNTFGTNCSDNTFGNNYFNNSFGNNCSRNTFGNNRDNINRINVLNGVQNKTLSVATNVAYCQFVGLTTSGNVRVWNPADE